MESMNEEHVLFPCMHSLKKQNEKCKNPGLKISLGHGQPFVKLSDPSETEVYCLSDPSELVSDPLTVTLSNVNQNVP
jgi:hypothetical protein